MSNIYAQCSMYSNQHAIICFENCIKGSARDTLNFSINPRAVDQNDAEKEEKHYLFSLSILINVLIEYVTSAIFGTIARPTIIRKR
jgi:hypothetical protein